MPKRLRTDDIRNAVTALFTEPDSAEHFRQFVLSQRRDAIAVYRQDIGGSEPSTAFAQRYEWHRYEWRSELFRDYVREKIDVRLAKCGMRQYLATSDAEWSDLPESVRRFNYSLSARVRELLGAAAELEKVILDRYGDPHKYYRVRGDKLQEQTGAVAQFVGEDRLPFALSVPKSIVLAVFDRARQEESID